MSNFLPPHGLQHASPLCPSPDPRVYSNSCPLSWWCHPTISSPVVPFSSHLQSFPASGSFPMSQLFASGGPSIGVSAPTSVLPMNTQDWSPLGWTGWISLKSTLTSTPCVCAKSLQSCLTLLAPEAVVHQTPLSIGFSRQEYWGGFPCPPSEDLPDSGIEPQSLMSPVFAGGFFITSTTWEGICCSSKNLRKRQ